MKEPIPNHAYWNCMNPSEIIDVLNVIFFFFEIRMITRLIPYMKIVKYEGRFGQYGLHGQAILFAQYVSNVQMQVLSVLP